MRVFSRAQPRPAPAPTPKTAPAHKAEIPPKKQQKQLPKTGGDLTSLFTLFTLGAWACCWWPAACWPTSSLSKSDISQ